MMMKFKDFIKKFSSKSSIKFLTVGTVILFIVITSLVNVGLDPNNFNFSTWLLNTILSVTISVAGLLLGEAIASDYLKEKANGLYQLALQAYLKLCIAIMPIIIYFADFLMWFREKETFNKQVDYLISYDIKEARDIIKHLEIQRVDELLLHPIELPNKVIVRKKTQEQVNAIKKVLEGKVFVKSSSASYYLNAFENHSKNSILEEGQKIDKDTHIYTTISRTRKLVLSIFISIIFATITFQEIANAKLIVVLANLIIRIFTFLSCLYCGWHTSAYVVKELSKKIENKTKVLGIFKTAYDTKEFKPTEYEDLARQEYEEYLRNINEQENIEESEE